MDFSHFWEVLWQLKKRKLVIFGIFKILLFFPRNLYLLKIKGHYPAHLNACATLGRPGRCLRLTITDIIMKNGHTRRANTAAVYQGIYAYSCLAGGCRHLPLPLFFSTLWLLPWDSYQFVLILPHPVVVVWKLRCREKGESVCARVFMCVRVCLRVLKRVCGGGGGWRRKARKSESVYEVAGVGGRRGSSLGF